jgi:hypothetical protein
LLEVKRPAGVTLIALFLAINAIVSVLGAVIMFKLVDLPIAGGMEPERNLAGLGYLILAGVQAIVGFGFWTMRGWAWALAVILQAIHIVVGVLQVLFVGLTGIGLQGIVEIAIALIIIFYLTRRPVLDAFVLQSLERDDLGR